MKILHVIPSVSARHGGPSKAVETIARLLAEAGHQVTVLTTDNDGDGRRIPAHSRPNWEGVSLVFMPQTTQFYTFSWRAMVWIWRNIGRFDCVHVHALFSALPVFTALASIQRGLRCVVRPLGTLSSYGLRTRRPVLKRLSLALFERRILAKSAAVHCTSRSEEAEVREVVSGASTVVIPLALPVESFDVDVGYQRVPFRVLFLSRLDPKKNIEALLRAIPLVVQRVPAFELQIAGSGDSSYIQALHALARTLAVEKWLTWLGHVNGDDKHRAFAEASLFVLPSHSENFGIAVAEALAAGLPCLLSSGVALCDDVVAARAGAAVDCAPEPLARAIGDWLLDDRQRAASEVAARELAIRLFSPREMRRSLLSLYGETDARKLG